MIEPHAVDPGFSGEQPLLVRLFQGTGPETTAERAVHPRKGQGLYVHVGLRFGRNEALGKPGVSAAEGASRRSGTGTGAVAGFVHHMARGIAAFRGRRDQCLRRANPSAVGWCQPDIGIGQNPGVHRDE